MIDIITAALVVAGSFFALVAAIGVVRFPDTLCRMHAATKAGAFGASLLLLAAALSIGSVAAAVKATLIVLFFYLTAPIAAHLLAREILAQERKAEEQS